MPNPHPKRENLKPNYSQWRHKPIKVVRIPEPLADRILEIAHQLDCGELVEQADQLDALTQELEATRLQLGVEARKAAAREEALVKERNRLQRLVRRLEKSISSMQSPSPLEILNKLRGKNRKTRTTETDVRLILEICQNPDS